MKKATLTLAISFAFGALVYAGPEQYSGKEMKQVAPVPPACPSWTGFYIGGFAGYKFASTDIRTGLSGEWLDAAFMEERGAIEAHAPHDLDTSGAELGGLLGYNHQWHNWVFGVEADGGYLWLRDSRTTGIFEAASNSYHVAASLKSRYLFTVGPRIGYALCRWLPYITGGLAVGEIDFKQNVEQNIFSFHDTGSVDDARVGWMIGGGLEYAFTDHWRIRGQYQYIDLGCAGFHALGIEDSLPDGFDADPEACLREHNVSVALIYRF